MNKLFILQINNIFLLSNSAIFFLFALIKECFCNFFEKDWNLQRLCRILMSLLKTENFYNVLKPTGKFYYTSKRVAFWKLTNIKIVPNYMFKMQTQSLSLIKIKTSWNLWNQLFLQHSTEAALHRFFKRLSENMQQICTRTPMAKCDFIKVAKQLY